MSDKQVDSQPSSRKLSPEDVRSDSRSPHASAAPRFPLLDDEYPMLIDRDEEG